MGSMLEVFDNIKFVDALQAQSIADGTTYGTGFLRTAYESGVFAVARGPVAGSPSAFSVAVTVQESDSLSTGYTDVSVASTTQTLTYTGDSSLSDLDLIKLDFRPLKKYLRIKVVASFTSGSSPTMPLHVCAAIGNAKTWPVGNTDAV